jgi:outer membrane receptor for ferrienterochelin and colicins
MYLKFPTAVTMCAIACPALAQEVAPPAQVVVNGSQTDIEAGRDFVAGKKIISRKRIEDSGLSTVEALLKRDPAVTVGANGRVGLQGMPGYTQFLIDGAPPGGGKSLQLELANVEKIEIIKSAVAEYGPYGIAGTINIITRKVERKTQTDVTVGAGSTGGLPAANIALSHNNSSTGSPLRFRAQLSASEKNVPNKAYLTQTASLDGQPEQVEWNAAIRGRDRFRTVDAGGDVNWQISSVQSLSISPNIGRFDTRGHSSDNRRWVTGQSLDAQSDTDTAMTMLGLPLKWLFKPHKKSQVEVNLRRTQIRANFLTDRTDAVEGRPGVDRQREQKNAFDGSLLSITYKAGLSGGHDIKLGASYRGDKERSDFNDLIDGQPDTALNSLGSRRNTSKKQSRLFVQDDWRFSKSTAVNVGVTGEDTDLNITEAGYHSRPRYRLWSPSAHLSHKISGDDDRQLRLSVARTYRAPSGEELSLRPVINPLAPCRGTRSCTPNSVDTADTAGNPDLEPERSLGVNLSYERGLGPDSQMTVEVFARRIDRKTGTEIALEEVLWSSTPRYVARPVNIGDAEAEGISLELGVALRDVFDGKYPTTNARAGLGLARSRISTLPGPDDRLDSQMPWNAKLGMSHAVAGMPLKIDLDASWTPGRWVRSNLTQRVFQMRRFDFNAGATWTVEPNKRLVVNLSNLGPGTSRRIDEYELGREQLRTYTDSKKYATLSVSFETKL